MTEQQVLEIVMSDIGLRFPIIEITDGHKKLKIWANGKTEGDIGLSDVRVANMAHLVIQRAILQTARLLRGQTPEGKAKAA